jgi:hypothetical protein
MPKAQTQPKGKHVAQTTFKGRGAFAAMARELQRADVRAADDLRRSAPLRKAR